MSARHFIAATLQRHWWRSDSTVLAIALLPLAAIYRLLAWIDRSLWASGLRKRLDIPVPVWIVGNLIVGGAGKTPTTRALVDWLKSQGRRPGIISRGYGRSTSGLVIVNASTTAEQCGDEALLLHLRTHVPLAVSSQRAQAARMLLAAHPEIDILVSDDGLQHGPLKRDLSLIVFDGRGVGNGHVLPAGPLRQPLPKHLPPGHWVVYNAAMPSTPLPGPCALRGLAGVVPLAAWWAGDPPRAADLDNLCRRSMREPLLAAAGIAEPERFFGMLREVGLHIEPLPLADHTGFEPLPWPDHTSAVLVTEKDAVKLRPGHTGGAEVWVVPLDFQLPAELTEALSAALEAAPPTQKECREL